MPLTKNFRNLVVIGASAGGVEAIIGLLRGLPGDYPGALLIVQHIPAYSRSHLDSVLQAHTELRVKKADDGEPIEGGTIYVARADRHLLLDQEVIAVAKGPRENRFRPAVDTLFRSAAHAYRDRVVGVVLSGALNDGTSGMWTIKQLGGTAIVQKPEEAMFRDMPEGVMQYTDVDYVLPVGRIGNVLQQLATRPMRQAAPVKRTVKEGLLELEVEIARGRNGLEMEILEQGKPAALACPECHGALTQFEEGTLLRFRCHTGHAHTAESLLASIEDNVEKSMWEVMRGLEENNLLLEDMASQLERVGQHELAAQYRDRSRRVQAQATLVQHTIIKNSLSEASTA